MIDRPDHIAWTAEALTLFQRHSGTSDEHAIADLICDLGQWRLATLKEAKAVVTQFHKYLKENSLIKLAGTDE